MVPGSWLLVILTTRGYTKFQVSRQGELPVSSSASETPMSVSRWRPAVVISLARVVALLLGALQAVIYSTQVYQEDAVSYLDMASGLLHGDAMAIFNTIWSPLYPLLLSAGLAIFQPGPQWEAALVKGVNFAIYALSIASFEFFLRRLLACHAGESDPAPERISDSCLAGALYFLFLYSSLGLGHVYVDTPDGLVALFMYLATGLLLAIWRNGQDKTAFLLLGLALGLGYWAKAIFLPLSAVYLLLAFFCARRQGKPWSLLLPCLATFLVVSTPLLVATSIKAQRLTFSDAGRFNYIVSVAESSPDHHAQGPALKHAPRQIFANPQTFAFERESAGCYPVWYEPGYWLEGAPLVFIPEMQLVTFGVNVQVCLTYFLGALLAAWAIGSLLSQRSCLVLSPHSWLLLGPALACLVFVSFSIRIHAPSMLRFLPGMVVLLSGWFLTNIRVPESARCRTIKTTTILIVAIPAAIVLAQQFILDAIAARVVNWRNVHWQIAQDLMRTGLKPGDRVAQMGFAPPGMYSRLWGFQTYYWARLAGLHITVDIIDDERFPSPLYDDLYRISPERRRQLIDMLSAKYGIKAIVLAPGRTLPRAAAKDAWIKVGNFDCYVLPLAKTTTSPESD